MINIDMIHNCINNKLSFPEVIRQLSEIDIERYYIDLVRMEKTYYSRDDESYRERIAIENTPTLAHDFDQTAVIEAIRASQKGQIDYPTFLKHIIAAGTASYMVYLNGKQVVYAGRNGELHTEKFHF